MANGPNLNSSEGGDGRTYLYANSGDVILATGVATELLNFRTPNDTCELRFEIFIPSALTVAGDRFVIKYYQNAVTAEKFDFLQDGTGSIIRPIIINKVLDKNTPFIVEVQYTKSASGPPAVTGSCNVSGRVL